MRNRPKQVRVTERNYRRFQVAGEDGGAAGGVEVFMQERDRLREQVNEQAKTLRTADEADQSRKSWRNLFWLQLAAWVLGIVVWATV